MYEYFFCSQILVFLVLFFCYMLIKILHLQIISIHSVGNNFTEYFPSIMKRKLTTGSDVRSRPRSAEGIPLRSRVRLPFSVQLLSRYSSLIYKHKTSESLSQKISSDLFYKMGEGVFSRRRTSDIVNTRPQ